MSRKPHSPDAKSRGEVSALCSYGIPHEEIANYLGIDAKTLRKYYRAELDTAHIKANATVGRFLFQNASGATLKEGASYSDCVRAAMFWAKTRMNWRETGETNQAEGGSYSPDSITVSIRDASRRD